MYGEPVSVLTKSASMMLTGPSARWLAYSDDRGGGTQINPDDFSRNGPRSESFVLAGFAFRFAMLGES